LFNYIISKFKRSENMDNKKYCVKCDWFSSSVRKCTRPISCKVLNEYFKDDNKDKLIKEGDFYYTFL
jgi:hypothetical protein